MPKTTTTCPRCRQPVLVEVEQLFDLNTNPRAKQNLLSGAFNRIRCPNCSYEGTLSTPIVYHDPEKQLLLTYFPPSLGLPVNEQERLIGPLITQVTNKLPPDKRKAYLLRPQTMLTMETMVERILEAE
ncbi:MAG: CpXC domain-containing protein, partial [Anaerolineaceae bacterium]